MIQIVSLTMKKMNFYDESLELPWSEMVKLLHYMDQTMVYHKYVFYTMPFGSQCPVMLK